MSSTHGRHGDEGGDVQKLAKLINGIKYAMLTTAMPDGTLRSRPMATQQAEFDGTLWFFTHDNTGKVDEIRADQHVNLGYSDPSGNRYVSVSGRATVLRDRRKAEELWTEIHRAWFPDGLDDPTLALLRVDVTDAEYWDGPSTKVAQLAGFVKAVVTGQSATNIGENRKIHL
ncbi:MAG: General stress protein [uncultured Phycisphaerae bacterium]|uniref:General stress protein n=1 Tax=uncultured Phycisphaerae bacterium TaxID=904963 RepID=A0A6J4QNW3_9BACT|nr:MAG: General stress protein [uncultured Phycisphaerae bacterium]